GRCGCPLRPAMPVQGGDHAGALRRAGPVRGGSDYNAGDVLAGPEAVRPAGYQAQLAAVDAVRLDLDEGFVRRGLRLRQVGRQPEPGVARGVRDPSTHVVPPARVPRARRSRRCGGPSPETNAW